MSGPVYKDIEIEFDGKEELVNGVTILADIEPVPASIGRGSSNPQIMIRLNNEELDELAKRKANVSTGRGITAPISVVDDYCFYGAKPGINNFNSKEEIPLICGVTGEIGSFNSPAEDRYIASIASIANTSNIPTGDINDIVTCEPVYLPEDDESGIVIDSSMDDSYLSLNQAVNDGYDTPEDLLPPEWNKYMKEVDKPVVMSKRELSLSFMLLKDTVKIDLKALLNSSLAKHTDRVKFIKDLYNLKSVYKSFKNLNFATKRIILNNVLRKRILIHSAEYSMPLNDILVLLENDTNHSTYLHNLKIALNEMVSKGIKLV